MRSKQVKACSIAAERANDIIKAMLEQPTLKTARLILRPLRLSDARDLQRLAGDRAIAATTCNIPHPYEDGMAENFITNCAIAFQKGEMVNFAVTLAADGTLVGGIGLTIARENSRAEMGYWIGKPYWNRRYATEAASAVLKYDFETLNLNRIFASHFENNPASGRVMQKIGMKREGILRKHILKWGEYLDLEQYGMLKREYLRI